MRFKHLIGILTATLATVQTVSFAFQAPKEPTGAQSKTEQSQKVEFIAAEELKARIAKNRPVTIVDVRGPSVYAQSDKTVQGAIHAKVRRVAYRLREVPRDSEVVTYCACAADEAAIIAARSLMSSGFTRVRVLKGGWNAWLQADGQLRPRLK
jgi:rhodanese-related sulfurtransferase